MLIELNKIEQKKCLITKDKLKYKKLGLSSPNGEERPRGEVNEQL